MAQSASSPGRRRPPGSTDVARLAGVSQKTVSRVFNDEPYVSETIRERVLAVARELGYRPNGAARALNSGKSHRLGVVSIGSSLFGPASMLLGVEARARSLGYAVSVVNTEEGDVAGVSSAVDALLQQGVDGIVLSEPIDLGPLELVVEVPVLTLCAFPGLHAPTVIVAGGDATAASVSATQHLLNLGHATVHHVAGPQRWYSARERRSGWLAALSAAGIDAPLDVEGDWSAASGYDAAQRLLAGGPVTAIFSANDDMAIGVIRALTERGVSVPEDVSVVGFDDVPTAGYLNPPLTTVAAKHGRYADRGLEALVRKIEGKSPAGELVVSGTLRLVVRASTAPAHSAVVKSSSAAAGAAVSRTRRR